MAAVGSDRVLIGAHGGHGRGGRRGGVSVQHNGTLLTTFTNPTPAADDSFG